MQEKDRFSLSTTINKIDSDKKNLGIKDLLAEIMPLQKFFLVKSLSIKEGSRGIINQEVRFYGKNSSDPPNDVANERLLKKFGRKTDF